MIIGFTGTRQGMTPRQHEIVGAMVRSSCTEAHHGDCIGADEEFHGICVGAHVKVIIHPPEKRKWRAFCKGIVLPEKDYLIRNRDIVDACELLIAAPKEQEEPAPTRGQGTWSTVRYARGKRRPCAIVKPSGAVEFVLGTLVP